MAEAVKCERRAEVLMLANQHALARDLMRESDQWRQAAQVIEQMEREAA